MERLTVKSILGGWTLRVPRQEAVNKLAAYEDAEEQRKCINCKHCKPLERNADLNGMYWHCSILRGEETRNVWHKYSRHYQEYSLVGYDDYCSSFELDSKE